MTNELILSPSGMNMYITCQYSFYLRYIKKLKPIIEDDTALKLGKSVHSVLENFYKNVPRNVINPDTELTEAMKKTAQEKWDRSVDAKKRQEMDNAIVLWLQFEIQRYKKYKEMNILERFYPVSVEEDITDWTNKLRAIIDKRCVGMQGTMYALDYKTDKSLPAQRNFKGNLDDIDIKYKIQSGMNGLVLKSQNINLDNFYFQFVRYPDKLLSVPMTSELYAEVNGLIKEIREKTEFVKNQKSCFYCQMKAHCKTENSTIHCITGDVI